jgi:hypothetical protein
MCSKNQWAFGEIITTNKVNEKAKQNQTNTAQP